MKATGIVKIVDDLGRIVLPKTIRRTYEIDIKDSVEIFTDEKSIIIRKYEPSCIFCSESQDIIIFRDKKICKKCLKELKS